MQRGANTREASGQRRGRSAQTSVGTHIPKQTEGGQIHIGKADDIEAEAGAVIGVGMIAKTGTEGAEKGEEKAGAETGVAIVQRGRKTGALIGEERTGVGREAQAETERANTKGRVFLDSIVSELQLLFRDRDSCGQMLAQFK